MQTQDTKMVPSSKCRDWSQHSYMASYSVYGVFAQFCVLAAFSHLSILAFGSVNSLGSLFSANSALSLLSVNSFASIASVNCAFCLGCVQKSFAVCPATFHDGFIAIYAVAGVLLVVLLGIFAWHSPNMRVNKNNNTRSAHEGSTSVV